MTYGWLRRFLLLLLVISVPVAAAAPALARYAPVEHVTKTPLPKKHKAKKAPKKSKAAKKTKKKKKKAKKKATATPVLVIAPSATPLPTDIPTITATPASTATPTSTPTPLPSNPSLQIRAQLARGYQVGYYVCGLPANVNAAFNPDPVTSLTDSSSPLGGSAPSVLTVAVPYGLSAGSYLLGLYAFYRDVHGTPVIGPSSGATFVPQSVLLTVDAAGNATLAPSSAIAVIDTGHCSTPPSGFGPPPTPQPTAVNIQISSYVSDPHPTAGEVETVYGTFMVNNHPVSNVLMRTNWYFPHGVQSCYANTNGAGTAFCSMTNKDIISGDIVQLQVIFEYQGQTYTSYTSFHQ